MSAAMTSEEQFLCSICLEVFSEPVSTPCGHNFCKCCLSQHWGTSVPCKCPLCLKTFDTMPELNVNTLLLEMVSQFKLEVERSESQLLKPGEVPCDLCAGTKLKAVKSCLVCLSSFCEKHLQPHLSVPGLKIHQLMEPVNNLEHRMCPKHQRPLELFCGTDQSCICTMCVLLEHKNHDLLSLEEACERKKPSVLQDQFQHMVEQRRLQVQEIQHCLELSQSEAQTEINAGLQAFTALIESVQSCCDLFLEQLQEKQSQSQRKAEEMIQQLMQEICGLEKRSSEAQQLSCSTDHLHFLQRCTELTELAAQNKRSSVSFKPETYEGSGTQALSKLEDSLSVEFCKVFKELALKSSKAELRRVQQFAVDITLDPDTAQSKLVLSEDLKEVHHCNTRKDLTDNPERFTQNPVVLGKQNFVSGRFYFEVVVKGKIRWEIGVVRNSIHRNGIVGPSPKNGHWTIWFRENKYRGNDDPPVVLSLKKRPQKVGVFVDYSGGVVSFYDVESAELIYSFTGCCFRESLLSYFCPYANDNGTNSAPLIISPIV